MFQENDNLYPAKPEMAAPRQSSRFTGFVISLVLAFVLFIVLVPGNYWLGTEIILILLFHEAGHLIMMKYYGYKPKNVYFIPLLGAMISGTKSEVSQRERIMINLMGPLPGIMIGCVLYLAAINRPDQFILVELSLLLLSINMVNLLPLDPLDGGNIFELLFFPANEKMKMIYTLISSLLVIGLGVWFSFYPLIIFGFLMAFKVRAYQRSKAIHEGLEEMEINYRKSYQELSDREYWTMRRVFLEKNPRIKEIIPEENVIWENERLLVDQINQLLRNKVIKDMNLFQIIIAVLIVLAALIFPVYLVLKNYHLVESYLGYAAV